MKNFLTPYCILVLILLPRITFSDPGIHINQVGFDSKASKIAVVSLDRHPTEQIAFSIIDLGSNASVFQGMLTNAQTLPEWFDKKVFMQADFTALTKMGKYRLTLTVDGKELSSPEFLIDDKALAKLTIPSITHYYFKQRANTPQELEADAAVKLQGSDKTVNIQGGWADASGDISKYFSHLAYSHFMPPQQIPLVTWSMTNTVETIPDLLAQLKVKDSLQQEALYGADYILRSLSPDNYFYMTVFSFFNPDPKARRIVGLNANSVVTSNYQCAFRDGGGMGIAALARISRWKKDGAYTSAQYLDGAKRAFDHLLKNNLKYADDGKENILDDYCALLAATELWIATNEELYQREARKRAVNLKNRMSGAGYFIADDADRPFWHASDAGLPVVALARYANKESDAALRSQAIAVIKQALDYNFRVTNAVSNPFGYARQTFKVNGKIKDGFFIPHENETGWWWQGENARIASLATAAIVGGKLAYPSATDLAMRNAVLKYASQQLSWVLGGNPYSMCFMYGFGKNNVPYMKALFGHGSQRGGISNGITGKDGNADGSGIDFKQEDNGNEWRWTEQWIPHAAWFLQAVTAMAE